MCWRAHQLHADAALYQLAGYVAGHAPMAREALRCMLAALLGVRGVQGKALAVLRGCRHTRQSPGNTDLPRRCVAKPGTKQVLSKPLPKPVTRLAQDQHWKSDNGASPCSRCRAGAHRRRLGCRCRLCSIARTDGPPSALQRCSPAGCSGRVQRRPHHAHGPCMPAAARSN